MLAELGDLRGDDDLAVRAVGVQAEVIPVILLGRVEDGERGHLRDDVSLPDGRALDLGDHLAGGRFLGGVPNEDDGPILGPYVVPLAVERRWVVDGEEDGEQVVVGEYRRVESDLDNLCVARVPFTDLLVARIEDLASAVTGDDAGDAAQIRKDGFRAPKASATQGPKLDAAARGRCGSTRASRRSIRR